MKPKFVSLSLILFSFALGIYFYPQMPAKMATHWNISGSVNGFMPKIWGLFLFPVISVFIYLLFIFLPKIDPKKHNISKFKDQYDVFVNILLGFLFYLYLLTIIWNFGIEFDFGKFLAPGFAVLFYFTGSLLGKARPNWFIGIRTPWTLSNEKVWNKTHKQASILFKISALVSLAGFFLPQLAFFLVIIPVIIFSLYLMLYSYIEYYKTVL